MKLNPRNTYSSGIRIAIYSFLAVFLSIVQFGLLNFIEVDGITPDLPLLLCIWISLREGRFFGIIAGFLIGITLDFFSFDLLGTNALTKTIAAFISGTFYKEGKEEINLKTTKFLLIVFISSFIHNLIYFFFYIQITNISFFNFFFRYGVAFSFYTTVFGIFPMVVKRNKKII